jgi:hypothetical protein
MEPRCDESAIANSTSEQQRRNRRFRIVKLEERVAPSQFCHANNAQRAGHHTYTCLCYRSASGH